MKIVKKCKVCELIKIDEGGVFKEPAESELWVRSVQFNEDSQAFLCIRLGDGQTHFFHNAHIVEPVAGSFVEE